MHPKGWLLALLLAAAAPALGQSATGLTLEQALDQGWAANPSIEQAKANFDRAEALVVQSRANWLPTLTLNGVYTQLDRDRSVGGVVTTAASTFTGSAVLNLPLVAGPRWLATGQAIDAREAARLDVAALQRDVASLVGRAWLQVRLQQRVVEVAERASKVSSDELELARAREGGGIGTRLDTVRAERELADNEGRLALTRADLAVARYLLGALLGKHGPVDIVGEPALPEVPAELSLSLRPDLAAAEARVALAQRRADESWVDYLPSITAVVGPQLQWPAFPPTPPRGVQGQILASVPLYDGGARLGLARERAALLRQAQASRDELLVQAEAQVQSAKTQLDQRLSAAEASRRSATLAQEASQLAKLAYTAGASTNLEVIEAERTARDAETNASVLANGAETARLDLLVAVGALTPGAPK